MPVSETYFLQWLLERSTADPAQLSWKEANATGYCTAVAGVRLWLHVLVDSTGSRLAMDVDDSLYRISIVEPRVHGLLTRRHASESDRRLAELLNQLFAAASRQVARRIITTSEMEATIRERLFRRVLFEEPDSNEPCGPVKCLAAPSI